MLELPSRFRLPNNDDVSKDDGLLEKLPAAVVAVYDPAVAVAGPGGVVTPVLMAPLIPILELNKLIGLESFPTEVDNPAPISRLNSDDDDDCEPTNSGDIGGLCNEVAACPCPDMEYELIFGSASAIPNEDEELANGFDGFTVRQL